MPEVRFRECHPKFNAAGYACVNEEPERFDRVLQGMRFRHVAGIASAGEVGLMSLLPPYPGWTLVRHVSGIRTTWNHALYQALPPVVRMHVPTSPFTVPTRVS